MENEIAQVENKYQINLQRLENYILDMLQNLKKWRISTYKRNWYFRYLQRWKQQQIKYLEQSKEQELKEIHEKYAKLSNQSDSSLSSPKPTGTKKACLIGINYVNTKYELNGCVNDVLKLKNILKKKYHYRDNYIKIITNEEATRNNILECFTELVKNAKEGDQLFFSFSGHGVYVADREKDEQDGYDELIVSADFYGITDDELKGILQANLKKGVNMFALFDNCHSGTILDLRYQYLKNNNRSSIVHLNCDETNGHVVCLSGSRDDQISEDAYINNKYNGAMTWAFTECLSNASDDLSWESCTKKVRELLEGKKFLQKPQLTSGKEININDHIQL